ncbi:alanine racemase [Acetobacter oeni]|uniref:Alanine racemase n=2 Tax=Acetobacter oeni TaxID=304077 RepID=A0A511XLK4_9PROT|nr:alanine racemase [Acetobacter oeni]NHO19652.1 alanine racemase [Acetobacter oeni]GEN63818.1 alanine racemase [Acetobacter oeni]
MDVAAQWAGGALTIDLSAIAANYRLLSGIVARNGAKTVCGAAIKADAYGLGADRVAPVLERAGCRHFFVAHLSEGASIRDTISRDIPVFVLHGPPPGTSGDLLEAGLTPVLNSPEQLEEWRALAARRGKALPAAIQLDSGMARFGLTAETLEALADDSDSYAGIDPVLVMSHLACADVPGHPANRDQLVAFRRLSALLPRAPRSLAASSGIFLGSDWYFDLVRPGAALYGINPCPGRPGPMRPVVRLQARVIQTRSIPEGQSVGYGALFTASRPTRVALLGIGYGDGFHRSASSRGRAVLPSHPDVRLPIIGRVSMDSLAVDITDLGDIPVPPGTALDLIGPHNTLEEAAEAAGTIGYELLTDLGGRYHRSYIDVAAD